MPFQNGIVTHDLSHGRSCFPCERALRRVSRERRHHRRRPVQIIDINCANSSLLPAIRRRTRELERESLLLLKFKQKYKRGEMSGLQFRNKHSPSTVRVIAENTERVIYRLSRHSLYICLSNWPWYFVLTCSFPRILTSILSTGSESWALAQFCSDKVYEKIHWSWNFFYDFVNRGKNNNNIRE